MKILPHTVCPALCLDLDSTVRRCKSGKPFIETVDDIEIMPAIESLIWKYRELNWLIFGISNQAGVSWGFKTTVDVEKEVDATTSLFKENPFHIIKTCFHDAKGKVFPYNYRSLGRKPDIGMLFLMEVEALHHGYVVDWDKSLFVGDRSEDEECAKNARIKFRHIHSFLNEPHEFQI